jgi:hypothetical protein
MIVTGDMQNCVKDMRDELDDHLAAINENTEEIEMNYSYLINMDQRLKLLEKKMDVIMSMLSKITCEKKEEMPLKKIHISQCEQEIFLLFYQAHHALDYDFMCRSLRKSEQFVRACVSSLIEKGVPIQKHVINRKIFFDIDSGFKELQAKKGIVNIVKTLTLDCFDQSVLQ